MKRFLFRAKIHRATITQADLHYQGSLTIDRTLMEASDLMPYEQVTIVNVTNGERIETYVIPGDADSGVICLNGAAARRGAPGDLVIIMAYGIFDETELAGFTPTVVHVDRKNRIVDISNEQKAGATYEYV